jgi:hypothetical protein
MDSGKILVWMFGKNRRCGWKFLMMRGVEVGGEERWFARGSCRPKLLLSAKRTLQAPHCVKLGRGDDKGAGGFRTLAFTARVDNYFCGDVIQMGELQAS